MYGVLAKGKREKEEKGDILVWLWYDRDDGICSGKHIQNGKEKKE